MDKAVNLNVDTLNREFMFNLGKLFASGAKVKILNVDDVNKKIAEEEKLGHAKSFNMLIKYWQDNNLSPQIFKGAGNKNNVFVICPVRNATPEEKEKLNKIISKYENEGYKVHYPQRNTNQSPMVDGENTGGYSICLENARAISEAKTIIIFYNKKSTGSMFDLGVTFYLQELYPDRKFFIENEFEYDSNNIIDKKIKQLVKNQSNN